MYRITWLGNKASIPTVRRLQGVALVRDRHIDFDDFGVRRGGWLEGALMHADLPVQHSICTSLSRMLECIKRDASSIYVLGSLPSDLSSEDIRRVYMTIEDVIAGMTSISDTSRNTTSSHWRRLISKSPESLRSGEQISDVQFRSRFPSHMSFAGRTAAARIKEKKSLLNESALLAVDHSNAESLRSGVEAVMTRDFDAIQSACWKTFEMYRRVRDQHRLLIKNYLGLLRPTNLPWLREPERALGLKLAEITRKGWHTSVGMKRLLSDERTDWPISRVLGLPLMWETVNLDNPFSRIWKKVVPLHEFFYCAYYMPRVVMEACQILLICRTCWNVDPITSLTPSDISKWNGYYQLASTKGRTKDVMSVKIFKDTDQKLYALIAALLEHNKMVDTYWERAHPNVWVTWRVVRKNSLAFTSSRRSEAPNRMLVKQFNLPPFTKKQLRDQAANILWLKHNDPYLVKEVLGHADLQTTLIYLHQHVLRLLSEANIRRFADRLAATIDWAFGQQSDSQRKAIARRDVDPKLLFPVRGIKASTSLCDEWIDSMGTLPLRLGHPEIEHLKWQAAYYSKYFETLKQDNPKAFVLYHLPRILFCSALVATVRESPYSGLLKGIS